MLPFHFMNLKYSLFVIFLLIFLIMISKKMNLLSTILMFNLIGLVPEFWCITSYLWSNILMGSFTWMLYSMNKMFKSFKFWSGHLLPVGTPLLLWSFLTILELISQMIRPLTLSLRLTCNMMAGHVLMSLCMSMNHSLILLIGVLFFEVCVALIQAIVFTLLISSYKDE